MGILLKTPHQTSQVTKGQFSSVPDMKLPEELPSSTTGIKHSFISTFSFL